MPAGIKRLGSTTYNPPKVVNVVTPNGSYYNNRYKEDVPPPEAQAAQGNQGSSAVQGSSVIKAQASAELGNPVPNPLDNFFNSRPINLSAPLPNTHPNLTQITYKFDVQNHSIVPTPQPQSAPNFGGLQNQPSNQPSLLANKYNDTPYNNSLERPIPQTSLAWEKQQNAEKQTTYTSDYLSSYIQQNGTPYQVIAGYDNKGEPVIIPAALDIHSFDNYDTASRAILWKQKKDMGYVLYGGMYIYVPGGFGNNSNYGGGDGGGGGGGGSKASSSKANGMTGVQPTPNQKPGIGGSSAQTFNTSTG